MYSLIHNFIFIHIITFLQYKIYNTRKNRVSFTDTLAMADAHVSAHLPRDAIILAIGTVMTVAEILIER